MSVKRVGMMALLVTMLGLGPGAHEASASQTRAVCGGQGNNFIEAGGGRKVFVSEYVNTVMGENTWRTTVSFDGGQSSFEVFGRYKDAILGGYNRLIQEYGGTGSRRTEFLRTSRLNFTLYSTGHVPPGYGYAGSGWCIDISW